MHGITKKTRWRIGLTMLLLGMAVCIYILISQTSNLDRAYLIQKGTEAGEPLALQPGESGEQQFYAYRAFDHIIFSRTNPETEGILDIEVTRDGQIFFSERVVFAKDEKEQEISFSGEKGAYALRLTNQGDTTVWLPALASEKYSADEWGEAADAEIQIEVYRISSSAKWCYYTAVLLLLTLSLAVLWGGGEKWTPGKAAGFILVLCLVYVLLFPAWNINDFGKHFATAYACANQILGVKVEEPDDLMIRQDDAPFFTFVLTDNYQYFYQPSMRSYDDAMGYLFQRTENNQLVPVEGITGVHRQYGIWNYLPYMLGIMIARLLSLNLVTAIFLARICGIGLYVAGIYFAMRKLPKGMLVPVTILSCMPVGVMNLTAVSYDAPCYVAILFLFAEIFTLRENYRTWDAICLAGCSLAVGLFKRGAYAPVLLSLLLLLRGKEKQKLRLVLCCALAGGLGLLLNYRGIFLGGNGLATFQSEGRGTYDIAWAISHPLDYFVMMIRTYLRQTDKIYSVVGKHLGRHFATIPDYVCGLFYLLLGLSVLRSEESCYSLRRLDRCERTWIWLPVVLMIALLPAMILDYTLLSWDTTDNVQGRYYLPLLIPILMLTFYSLRERVTVRIRDQAILLWGTGFLHLLSVYYIWLTFLRGA